MLKLRILFIVGSLLLPTVVTCDQTAAAALSAEEAIEDTSAAVIEETLTESPSVVVFWETDPETSFSEAITSETEGSSETLFIDPETEEESFFVEDYTAGPQGYFCVSDLQIGVPLYSVYDYAMDGENAAGLSRGRIVLDHVDQDNFSLLEKATIGMKAFFCKSDGTVKHLSCVYSGVGYYDGENYCLSDGRLVKEQNGYAALTCHNWPGVWVTLWQEKQ